jgi:hypothetical protein
MRILLVILVVASVIADYKGRKWTADRERARQERRLFAHLPLQ